MCLHNPQKRNKRPNQQPSNILAKVRDWEGMDSYVFKLYWSRSVGIHYLQKLNPGENQCLFVWRLIKDRHGEVLCSSWLFFSDSFLDFFPPQAQCTLCSRCWIHPDKQTLFLQFRASVARLIISSVPESAETSAALQSSQQVILSRDRNHLGKILMIA